MGRIVILLQIIACVLSEDFGRIKKSRIENDFMRYLQKKNKSIFTCLLHFM